MNLCTLPWWQVGGAKCWGCGAWATFWRQCLVSLVSGEGVGSGQVIWKKCGVFQLFCPVELKFIYNEHVCMFACCGMHIFKLRLSCEHDASNGVSQKALQQHFEYNIIHWTWFNWNPERCLCFARFDPWSTFYNSYKIYTCFVLVGMLSTLSRKRVASEEPFRSKFPRRLFGTFPGFPSMVVPPISHPKCWSIFSMKTPWLLGNYHHFRTPPPIFPLTIPTAKGLTPVQPRH